MSSFIYEKNIQKRIERLKVEMQARDYEGCSTVLTSDIKELLSYIDKLESVLEDTIVGMEWDMENKRETVDRSDYEHYDNCKEVLKDKLNEDGN